MLNVAARREHLLILMTFGIGKWNMLNVAARREHLLMLMTFGTGKWNMLNARSVDIDAYTDDQLTRFLIK